ncbi:MAG: FixH family protein [Burkholderiales bacterium]
MTPIQSPSNVWYREPWPWLLMAGPAIVVVAGIFTAVLAVRSDDGLVADDYYRRGLAINQTLRREGRARELHLAATVSLSGTRMRITLRGTAEPPAALRLRLIHPTRAGRDETVALRHVAAGLYEGRFTPYPGEPRRLVLEDEYSNWRLPGAWNGRGSAIELGAMP